MVRHADMTVLIDNIAAEPLAAEWGLSILLTLDGRKLLLDTGAGPAFARNAELLGIDLACVGAGVLSHAHYDHANGMVSFFNNNDKAKLYVRESTSSDCYIKVFIVKKYIGIPRDLMDANADRIEKVTGNYELMEGISLIPHTTKNLSAIGKRESMYRKTSRGWEPDDFSHEQSVVIDTDKGLLIINSCSHGGVSNIVNEVKAAFPGKQIYGYIGGLHLFNKKKAEVETVVDELELANLIFICTGHCTGESALAILDDKFGDKITKLHVGLRIDI